MRNDCSMCYRDRLLTSPVVEKVAGFKMLLHLCDDCLIIYSGQTQVKLDYAIHALPIDDYKQLTSSAQAVVDDMLQKLGLTRDNWNDWREQ